MAQKARLIVMAMLLAVPGIAQACERHERCAPRPPLVLNGRLNTADFTGGVGGVPDVIYFQGYSYGMGSAGAGGFAGSRGFASARASAFASASASAHAGGGGGHR